MKYLVFIVIVVFIWYAMRWTQQAEVSRRLNEERSKDRKTSQKRAAGAVETIICSRCRAYIPANSPTACDRGDCPYPAAV
jgi:hypothetical protein